MFQALRSNTILRLAVTSGVARHYSRSHLLLKLEPNAKYNVSVHQDSYILRTVRRVIEYFPMEDLGLVFFYSTGYSNICYS